MHEATIEVRIPGELLEFGLHPQTIQKQLIEWLVISLFKEDRISSGRAAKLLGITRIEFLALLRRQGVAYLDYSPDELADELEVVHQLAIEVAA